MSETASEPLDAAVNELSGQEDCIRGMRHLSDEQLRVQLLETLRKEKAAVDGWLDAGDCFLLSGTGVVHLPNCPSMSPFIDRDTAWAPYLDELERVRNWHASDNAPPMPALLTRADVEALSAYKTCHICTPALDHTEKRAGIEGWTVLKAGSLNRRYLGTAFSLPDGSEIGVLRKITTVDTPDGTDFRLEFDGLDAPVTGPGTEVMYRTGTRTQP